MKKVVNKLSLGKETVSELTKKQLSEIAGGTGYVYNEDETPIYFQTEVCEEGGSFIVY